MNSRFLMVLLTKESKSINPLVNSMSIYSIYHKKMLNSLIFNKRIAFTYNPNEHYKKSFIFTLKSEDYYNSNKANEDPFLQLLNPDRILYCICFVKKDYLETVKKIKIDLIKLLFRQVINMFMREKQDVYEDFGSLKKSSVLSLIFLL